MNTRLLLILLCGLFSKSLNAHDFWLEAHPFIAKQGEVIEISVHVGENLAGTTLPNRLNWYDDFSYIYQGERREVPGVRGRDPAGVIDQPVTGTFSVGYQSVAHSAEIKSVAFLTYLHEEGLERFSSHQAIKPGQKVVEGYTRFAKALVQQGKRKNTPAGTENFGYGLELHRLENPYRLTEGLALPLRLTLEGSPVAGVQISAFCASRPHRRQIQRSNKAGEILIKLDCSGRWLVKAVEMWPSSDSRFDFESYWTSLSFEIR